jgi:hypothetical protein
MNTIPQATGLKLLFKEYYSWSSKIRRSKTTKIPVEILDERNFHADPYLIHIQVVTCIHTFKQLHTLFKPATFTTFSFLKSKESRRSLSNLDDIFKSTVFKLADY